MTGCVGRGSWGLVGSASPVQRPRPSGRFGVLAEAAGADLVGAEEAEAVSQRVELGLAASAHAAGAVVLLRCGVELVLEELTGQVHGQDVAWVGACARIGCSWE